MLFRTHILFSLAFFLIFYSFFQVFYFSLFFLFSILFVDVDTKKSKMGKILIFRPFQIFFKHRGRFHSLFFCFIFFCLFYFVINTSAAFGFLIGFLSHLFLDCLTLKGVILFWPISKKRIKGFFKTGGIFETFLFFILLFVDFYLLSRILF